MKIELLSSTLRDALSKLHAVVDKKNTRPILSNCLLKAQGSFLELCATDLEVTIKINLEAKIEGNGNFCINSKQFFDVLKELPESMVSLEVNQNENTLKLKCDKIQFTLLILSSEEYPRLDFEANSKPFEIKTKDITNFISKVSHAVSTDETRINLNGIYLQKFTQDTLRAVAIDGHRLAMLDMSYPGIENKSLKEGIIIPKKGIHEVNRLADTCQEDTIEISSDESTICFKVKDYYFLSIRLIAREYPKYSSVIPSKTTFGFKGNKESILHALRRVKLLANEKNNGVKFILSHDKLTLASSHPTLGEASEDLLIEYTGESIEIGFNAKYLMDSLNTIDDEYVNFEFNNELSPVVLKSDNNPSFLGIIMPLKI